MLFIKLNCSQSECWALILHACLCQLLPLADLGFPRGGGANSPGEVQTYDFAIFSKKLNEIERIWAPGGRVSLAPLLDPPLLAICAHFHLLMPVCAPFTCSYLLCLLAPTITICICIQHSQQAHFCERVFLAQE